MAKSNGKEKSQEKTEQVGRAMAPYPSAMFPSRVGWPLNRLRSEFDRLFDDFVRGWGGLSAGPLEREANWDLDVDDQDDKIVVRAEAPGFEADDFDLQVRDDHLVLCACESEEKKEDGHRQWHRRELYRSIPLSAKIDEEHIDAQYHNGILTVTLPKTERSKSRRIEVKS